MVYLFIGLTILLFSTFAIFGVFFFIEFHDRNPLAASLFSFLLPITSLAMLFAVRSIKKRTIAEVEITDMGITLFYGGGRKKRIPFEKIRLVVVTRSYFICLTSSRIQHNPYTRKGVICSGWFDKRIRKELMRKIKRKKIRIIERPIGDYYALSSVDGFVPIGHLDVTDLPDIFKGR